MRPRNAKERRVTELSATLPDISAKDTESIDRNYMQEYKSGLAYYLVFYRCKEFQVIRYYYKTTRSFFEFCQVWMNQDTKIVLAKNRFMGVDAWIRDSAMTIKDWFKYGQEYTYLGGIERIGWSGCIIHSLLPELRQRGLRTSTHGLNPVKLTSALLHSNRIETLFKLRQYRLVNYFIQPCNILTETLWQSIRVALRHGYSWDDSEEVKMWCLMIQDLSRLGLDTHNPHYIIPANLLEAHTHWRLKVEELESYERYLQNLEDAREYEQTFFENRKQFLDMTFAKGKVSILVIPTATAIVEEGRAMHHCVGEYYSETESLILSAMVDGKRMETIEVSLVDYKLVQSRGLQNKYTSYHNQIVSLVKSNLKEIKRRNLEHQLKIAV